MTFPYTYQSHTFQMYHYVSFNMALFSLLSFDILSFFERFFPQHSFFTQGSKFLLFKCIIMCPLQNFSCPLGYICFGSNINSFQHASNTYGRKNIQRNMFLSFFPNSFVSHENFLHGFATHTCFQKLKIVLTRVPSGQTHIETQKLTSSF